MCTGECHGQRSQKYKRHYESIELHRSILKEVDHSSEVLTPQTVYGWRDDKFLREYLLVDSAQISTSSIHGEARWSASWVFGIEQTKNVRYFIVFLSCKKGLFLLMIYSSIWEMGYRRQC